MNSRLRLVKDGEGRYWAHHRRRHSHGGGDSCLSEFLQAVREEQSFLEGVEVGEGTHIQGIDMEAVHQKRVVE